jgi:hypothetical protein
LKKKNILVDLFKPQGCMSLMALFGASVIGFESWVIIIMKSNRFDSVTFRRTLHKQNVIKS